MSYIKDSLSKGEEVYQIFKHHWMVEWIITMNFIVALASVGIWLIPAMLVWLSWKNTEQGVTNKRVISKHGIISRKTDELRLNAIESIFITQGVFGRVFGFGTVTITGRGQGDVKLKWMCDPLRVKREIESIEYGEKRAFIEEKDSKPSEFSGHTVVSFGQEKYYWLIGCLSLFTVIVVLVNISGNDKNKSTVQAAQAEIIELKQPLPDAKSTSLIKEAMPLQENIEPEKTVQNVNLVTDSLQDQPVPEEPQNAENDTQQLNTAQETKVAPNKSTTWIGNWDNDIVAIVNTEPCSEQDFLKEGYGYLITSFLYTRS